MKPWAKFGAVCLTVIAVLAALLGMFFRGPADRYALWVTGGVALVVQLAAFAAVLLGARRNLIVGWGAGIGIRFGAFLVWGFAVISLLELPHATALLSMASYLFVTTLIEPLFLKT